VPALANTPSGESGHSSYQHPARAASRAYSPDVDRFPHLVIATALRGLSAGGPALWEKYDNGDNLLFTEADFKRPPESKLMRELWQSGDPALQSLVGRLAVACTKPVPQTPWLDQVAPEGEPVPLDDRGRREAAAALGVAPPVPVPLPPEPPAVLRPMPVAPFPTPLAPAPAAVLETVALPDEDEANVELVEPPLIGRAGPRSAARRKKPARAKEAGANTPLLLIAGAAFLALVGGGVIAGVILGGKSKPDTSQKEEPKDPKPPVKGEGPKPKPKEKDGTGEPQPPKDKDLEPPPMPPGNAAVNPPDPPPGTVPELKVRKEFEAKSRMSGRAWFDREGRTVALVSEGVPWGVSAYGAETGESLAELSNLRGNFAHLFPLEGGRFAYQNSLDKQVTVWDPAKKTIEVRPFEAPADLAGRRAFVRVSPNGRYLAVSAPGAGPNRESPETQLRILDATNQAVVAVNWRPGAVLFTADSSRALVAEDTGAFRWYDLANGGVGGDGWSWGLKSNGFGTQDIAASADGSAVLYYGAPPEKERAYHLLDGKTGKVRYSFPAKRYVPTAASLSDDGRFALLVRNDGFGPGHALEVRGADGALAAQVKMPAGSGNRATPAVSWRGRAAAVYDRGAQKLTVYDLPEFVAPATAQAPKPPDPKPPEPKVVLPDVPALKEKWAVEAKAPPADASPRFDDDGQAVALVATTGPLTATAFAVKNRKPLRDLAPNRAERAQLQKAFGLDKGKFEFQTDAGGSLWLWDPETAKLTPKPFPRPPGAAAPYVDLSPDGRYLAVSPARYPPGTKDPPRTQLRVLDTTAATANTAVLTLDWFAGRTAFTADRRVLVVDDTDSFWWYTLRAKAAEKKEPDWSFNRPPDGQNARLLGVSAKGEAILYCGRPPGKEEGVYLLDGKTGDVRTSFPPKAYASAGWLSGDGRQAVLVRNDGGTEHSAEVVEAGGKRLGAVKLPKGGSEVVAVSWKAGLLVTYDREARRLAAYELPAAPPP
jgi:hypothetical protein